MSPGSDSATDRRWSLGFVLVAFAFLVAMLGTTLPTPLYPIYSADFGFSRLTNTVVFATYAVGVIAALVLVGDLSDRIGRRRVLVPGLVAAALSAVCFLAAHGLGLLLLGRFLSGVSAGVFTGTATATLLDLAPDEHRDRASLVATVVNMGGLGLGPLVAGLLAETLPDPLRLPYAVHLVLVALAVAGLAVTPEPIAARGRFVLHPRGLTVPGPMRAVFVRSAVAGFAGFAVTGLFTAVTPSILGEILGVTDHLAVGAVVMVLFAGSIAGQVARTRVSDRLALAGGCTVLIFGLALLTASIHLGSLGLLLAAAVVCGLGQGLSFAAAVGLVARAAPPGARAAVTSSLFVISYVAISLPVVGVGLLATAVGLITTGTVFAVAVAVLAALAAGSLALDRRP